MYYSYFIINEFKLLFLGLTAMKTIQESIAVTGIYRGTREQHLCRGIRLLRNVVYDKGAMPGKGILPTRKCFMVQIYLSYGCGLVRAAIYLIIHDTLANWMTHRSWMYILLNSILRQPLAIQCLQWAGVVLRMRNKRSPAILRLSHHDMLSFPCGQFAVDGVL